jgi:EmrB/QacA subfamily drug resistance transporter
MQEGVSCANGGRRVERSDRAASSSGTVDKRVVLFVASLANFLGSVMSSSVNIAIPSIGQEFAVDAITLSWIPTVFLMVLAMFMVPAGRLADIYGRKRVFLYGVVAWTITSLLCALATSATLLIVFRALQAVAGAMFFGNAMAIVTSVYPQRERGRALGINVAAVYVGLAAGPSVGGVMTQQLGWRSMFLLNSAMGAVIVVLIIWKIQAEWADAHGEKLDLAGSVIFAITLLSVMYGFSALPAMLGGWLILLGILCLAVFVWWEGRVSNPVLDINLFRHNVVFALSNLAALANYSATAGIAFLLSLYLQYVKGLDPETAGLILLAQPVMMVILSPLAGRLSDRVEPRIVSSTGMALTTLGLALLAALNDSSSLGYIVVALLIAGCGFGLFSSPNSNAVMGSVERSHMGVASATLGVMRSVGQMLSLGIATLIIAVYVGGVQITPQYHAAFSSGFRLAFTIFAILCFVGVFCSLARGKLHGGPESGPLSKAQAASRQ